MRNLKKILALVLALVMTFSVMSVAGAAYADQDAVDASAYKTAIEVLTATEVFKGDENGFRPEDTITRGEVAAVIYRIHSTDIAEDYVGFYQGNTQFADINDWYEGVINYCATEGLVRGYNDTTFAPMDNVTGYQVLAMILRALGYDKNGEFAGDGWETKVAQLSVKLGLLDTVKKVDLNADATRALVAELIFVTITNAKCVELSANGVSYVETAKTLADQFPTLKFIDNEKNVDEWGRAYTQTGWMLGAGKDAKWVSGGEKVFAEKLAEKTGFFTAKELEAYKLKGTEIAVYENGALNKQSTTAGIGGTGIVVELYADRIITIETSIEKVIAVGKDKAGNPTATLNTTYVNDKNETVNVVIAGEYTKGDYVVTEYNNNLEAGNTGYRLVDAETQIVEGKLNRISKDGVYTVDGKVITLADNFFKFVELKVGEKYNWIKDENGVVIAVDEIVVVEEKPEEVAPTYVIVLATKWALLKEETTSEGIFGSEFGNGDAVYGAKAQVMFLDSGEIKEVVLAGYYADNKAGYTAFGDSKSATLNYNDHGLVITNANVTYDLEGNLYEYTLTKTGDLVLKLVETVVEEKTTFTKGDATQIDGLFSNKDTIYFTLTVGENSYVLSNVVGFNNIKTFEAERFVYVAAGKYVNFVYNVVAAAAPQAPTKPADTSVSSFYYLTEAAEIVYGETLTLTGLVDMNGNAVELTLDASFTYAALSEMIELYAGTIIEIAVNTTYVEKDGKYVPVVTNDVASVMADDSSIEVAYKDADGKDATKTLTAKHIEFVKAAPYAMDADMLIVGKDVYYLNAVKSIVDAEGNKVELADINGKHLYIVYDAATLVVESIVVTNVTEETLEKTFADLKITAKDIVIDEALLVYDINGDVSEAEFVENLTAAILGCDALATMAKLGNVDVMVSFEDKTVYVEIYGYETALEIAFKVVEGDAE